MRKILLFISASLITLLFIPDTALAQKQYKLKQVTNMMSMKMESTIYVKGMRKRTENAGYMGMSASITIEQCDLKRFVMLNDKKKLYFIQPFAKVEEQVIEEGKPLPAPAKTVSNQKGGVINMYYNIRDTGERKQMYGFTARRIWTTQKIKPSPDACMMKDSMIIKTDGWYIDLPEFNCPSTYNGGQYASQAYQPECTDRFVTHTSGKGKLGFPLKQTTTMIMGGQTTEMSTSMDILEFSTAKLDSMLFEIPPGYQLAKSQEELQDKMDVNDMIRNMKTNDNDNDDREQSLPPASDVRNPNTIRFGIYEPTGNTDVQPATLQLQMISALRNDVIGNKVVEAVRVSSEEEARKFQCDYTVTTSITNIKSSTKVGGLLKAVRNADPTAASSYTVQASLTVKKLDDNSIKTQQAVDGKYDGSVNSAAGKALEDGLAKVIRAFGN